MPSPPSTGPSDARGRRSSAFVLKMQGLHLAQLLSVNVGQPREITCRGKTVYTSVWKEPVQLRTDRKLIGGRRSVEGWYAGTSIDSEDTLAFSVQSGVRSMNEVYPLERAAEAYDRMMSGKARFRVVLTM